MEYDPREFSGFGVHNTMLSKAYRDSAAYGKFKFINF